MTPHKERGRQARKEDLAAAASDYLAMTEWGGRSTQSVVYKFSPFGNPPRPPRDKKEGRDDGVGKGDPMRATGRKCSPTQSRRFSAGCPLPTLRTAANASSSRLLLGKLTSREDLSLQVRILTQKQ